MTKIKICGLRRMEDILAVNTWLPDYIGFVFTKESKRYVSFNEAMALKKNLRKEMKAVGVFVNEPVENIISAVKHGILDVIQLHGDEGETYIHELKKVIHVPIIKGIRVNSRKVIAEHRNLPVDYLLLDGYHTSSYGGTGKTFDYSLIPTIEKPFFLAGGLDRENLLSSIGKVNPYCVDISSGVETAGYKDSKKIEEVIRMIRTL